MIHQLGRHDKLDPKTMLLHASEGAHEYEEVVIVARKKDGQVECWSSTNYPWFLFACATILSDKAMKTLQGHLVDE